MQLDVYRSKFNPESTFSSRKKMYDLLERSQLIEYEMFEKIATKSTETKTRILEILSQYLLDMDVEYVPNAFEILEMNEISGLDLNDWREIRKTQKSLYNVYVEAERKLSDAQKHYDDVAPFGFISGWFNNSSQEIERLKLKQKLDEANIERNISSTRVIQQHKVIEDFAETFFRNCLANMKELVQSKAVGELISNEIRELEKVMSSGWSELKDNQQKINKVLFCEVELLKSSYF